MTTATPVQATFLHHQTAQPVQVDLPPCPTCGQTGPTCTDPTSMHPARRDLIAPLVGSPVPGAPLAQQPTIGDFLDDTTPASSTRDAAEAR